MATIRDFKYKLVKNFFSKEELNILKQYCLNKVDEGFKDDDQAPLCPSYGRDPLMQVFLKEKLPLMEKITGLQLLKTYSYWRYYIYGSVLKTHKDRDSCEISVTACIHKTHDWPIHMNRNWIEMEEGDAVVYMARELSHGRKKFEGDGCAQVFFHYVDKNGSLTHHENDQNYALFNALYKS
jgi:hypothetical protein